MDDRTLINSGFFRLNKLLVLMIDSVAIKNKRKLVRMANNFLRDSTDFISLLYENLDITDNDVDSIIQEQENAISFVDEIPEDELLLVEKEQEKEQEKEEEPIPKKD